MKRITSTIEGSRAIGSVRREEAQRVFEENEELWNEILMVAAFTRLRTHEPEFCPCCGQELPTFHRLYTGGGEYNAFLSRDDVARICINHIWYAFALDEDERDRPLYTR